MSSSWLLQQCPHFLYILFGWFVRWEVSGHTAAYLRNVASRISSRQRAAFLCSSDLAFSQFFFFNFYVMYPDSSVDIATT